MPEPAVCVVAATHRRPGALGRLLSALRRQTVSRDSFSVTVVNDGSHDGAYARVLDGFPFVQYLRLPRRLGPAAARNHGAAATAGAWLVFTDDDCLPPSDWLERFLSFDAAVDALGGRVELAPQESLGVVGRYLRDISFIRPVLGADGSLRCLPTANLAVRRAWFEKVRGFDSRFSRAGGEDMDLTYRLIRAGAKAEVADSWVTYHEIPGGFAQLCGRYFRYGHGETVFRRLRADAGLPPAASYARRIKALLGLAAQATGPRAQGALAFRLLTVTRQVSYELGRLCGRWARN